MDFVYILRELWRQRVWLVAGLIVAVVVGLAIGFHLSLFPLRLSQRTVSYGTAATKVVVDTVPSSLTDSSNDYDPLITRAGIYAELFSSTAVRRSVSLYSGIPADAIVVDVPSAGRLITNQGGPQTGASQAQRSTQLAGEGSNYRLEIDVENNLPVIEIAAEAPDQEQALRLANGAAEGLQGYLRNIVGKKTSGPSGRPIQIRRLGNAQGGRVHGRTGPAAALAIALGIFLVWCLIILGATTVTRRWTELDREAEGGWEEPFERGAPGAVGHDPLMTELPPDDLRSEAGERVGTAGRGRGGRR